MYLVTHVLIDRRRHVPSHVVSPTLPLPAEVRFGVKLRLSSARASFQLGSGSGLDVQIRVRVRVLVLCTVVVVVRKSPTRNHPNPKSQITNHKSQIQKIPKSGGLLLTLRPPSSTRLGFDARQGCRISTLAGIDKRGGTRCKDKVQGQGTR